MKLSVKWKFGSVRVRGGRILVVAHDHQVSTKGHDRRDDVPETPSIPDLPTQPFKPQVFGAWTTAKVGDLALEIVVQKTERLLGYVYLSGSAINVIRYVSDVDRVLVAGWFATGKGLRVSLDDPGPNPEVFVRSVLALKHGGADVVVSRVRAPGKPEMQQAAEVLARSYSYVPENDDGPPATAHLIVAIESGKHTCFIHLQPPKHAQDHALQPFFHEVLGSSPDLVDHEFLIKD